MIAGLFDVRDPVVVVEVAILDPVTTIEFTALEAAVIEEYFVLSPVTLAAGTSEDSGLWTGYGPPTTVIGSHPGDEYIDLRTGDLYQLT